MVVECEYDWKNLSLSHFGGTSPNRPNWRNRPCYWHTIRSQDLPERLSMNAVKCFLKVDGQGFPILNTLFNYVVEDKFFLIFQCKTQLVPFSDSGQGYSINDGVVPRRMPSRALRGGWYLASLFIQGRMLPFFRISTIAPLCQSPGTSPTALVE